MTSSTWWLDSGATIHTCNSDQVMISRSLTSYEQYVYLGNDTKFQVVFLGVVRLQPSIEKLLELQDVVYIPSIRGNLISIPILDRLI